jgi:hypothetical protein
MCARTVSHELARAMLLEAVQLLEEQAAVLVKGHGQV